MDEIKAALEGLLSAYMEMWAHCTDQKARVECSEKFKAHLSTVREWVEGAEAQIESNRVVEETNQHLELKVMAKLHRENTDKDAEIARLRTEVEEFWRDMQEAAGECLVEVPQSGTDAAKLLIANRIARTEIARLLAGMERLRDIALYASAKGGLDHEARMVVEKEIAERDKARQATLQSKPIPGEIEEALEELEAPLKDAKDEALRCGDCERAKEFKLALAHLSTIRKGLGWAGIEIARLRSESEKWRCLHDAVKGMLDQKTEQGDALTATVDGLREAQTCASCGCLICPPMQCGRCIETGRPVEGMPERPATINLQEKVQALTSTLEEAQNDLAIAMQGVENLQAVRKQWAGREDDPIARDSLDDAVEMLVKETAYLLRERASALPGKGEGKPPVCTHCDDTRRVETECGDVICPMCPPPCEMCGGSGWRLCHACHGLDDHRTGPFGCWVCGGKGTTPCPKGCKPEGERVEE